MKICLLFCLVVPLLAATDGDGGFEDFCTMDLLSSTHDSAQEENRYKAPAKTGEKATCQQTYTLPAGFTKEAAVEMCREKSPFPLNQRSTEASLGDKNVVTCYWEASIRCDKGSILLDQTCYRIETTCSGSFKLANLRASMFHWLPHFYYDQAVRFKSTARQRALPRAVYHRGYIHRDDPNFNNPKGPLVAVIHRFPVSGVYAGQFVQVFDPKDPTVHSLCENKVYGVKQTTTDGSEPTGHSVTGPKTTESGTAATAYQKICSQNKGWCMRTPRSLFQPRVMNGRVDMAAFHEHCAKFCTGCFAASDFHYQEAGNTLPNGRYYIPIASQKGVVASSDCQTTATQELANQFNQLRMISREITGSNLKNYLNGYPSNRCSDGGRLAVQYYKKDNERGLTDAPVFDRLPVYCVSGVEPPQPEGGKCMKNAEVDGSNCKCKSGYKDALNDPTIGDYARQKGAVAGQACLLDGKSGQTCVSEFQDQYNYEAVMILVDGSGSISDSDWELMVKFVENAHKWIPTRLKVMICQYAQLDGPYGHCTGLAQIARDWDRDSFQQQAATAMSGRTGGETWTYACMYRFLMYWFAFRDGERSKALMYHITDGNANDPNNQPMSIEYARSLNVDIKVVPVGKNIDVEKLKKDVKNPAEDVIPITGYANLQDTLMDRLQTEKCYYEEKHVDEAMQYSDRRQ